MMVPGALSPSALMNPPDALFDKVTSCARDPVARIALSASMTCVPEPTMNTACGLVRLTSAASAEKSGLLRSYFPRKTGLSLVA